MRHIVLLKGFVDDAGVDELLCSAQSYVHGREEECSLTIIIDSEGGLVVPALRFIHGIKYLEKKGIPLDVVIYQAKSVAAVIALSLGQKRSMKEDSVLCIHRGNLTLEASDFNMSTGKIYPHILKPFRLYGRWLNLLLRKYKLHEKQLYVNTLYATDWLSIPAVECKSLGLVDELF